MQNVRETLKGIKGKYVYLVQVSEQGPIKIGYTEVPWKRLSHIQVDNPSLLYLVGLLQVGDKTDETKLHAQFESDRLFGEWFWPSEILLKYIDSLAFPKQSIGTLGYSAENNSCWKGQEASKASKYMRLRRRIDKRPCDSCGNQSFDIRPKNPGAWDSIDPKDYQVLCRKCSMKLDGRLERFKELNNRPRLLKPAEPCSNCFVPYKPLRKGLCHSCDMYQRVHGIVRPFEELRTRAKRKRESKSDVT